MAKGHDENIEIPPAAKKPKRVAGDKELKCDEVGCTYTTSSRGRLDTHKKKMHGTPVPSVIVKTDKVVSYFMSADLL